MMGQEGVEFSEEVLQAAIGRMAGNIRAAGSFLCASCREVKKAEFLYSIGLFVPDGIVMTAAGEKKRVVIYPVCGLCGKKDPEKLAEESQQSIEDSAMLLDPDYYPPPKP
jgi:hypothetical protein